MHKSRLSRFVLVLLFTVLGFAVMGYHPGIEDDGIYLTAIKSNLNPALYPYDSPFFRIQVQATVFDKWVAELVKVTGISLPWTDLFLQLISLFVILWACHSIARQFFAEAHVQWAGVALIAALFTLPVTGTALYMVDQHLHPRTIATALILLAVSRIMARRRWQAAPLLLLAFLFHPIMAVFGVSFCIFLSMAMLEPVHAWLQGWSGFRKLAVRGTGAAAFMPLGWIFDPPNPVWRKALDTRTYYYLYKWTWYEWVGALVPLFLFWLLWRVAQKRGETLLARFALAVFVYGVFQQSIAMIVLAPSALVRLTPLQPMRYLQILYFFFMLLGGCLLGKYVLKRSVWRWAIFLLAINLCMFVWQRAMFGGTNHMELPGEQPANPWLQAFDWIQHNTPTDAYFALDPYYLAAPDEDYHSFRALAERSQLADAIKDTAVVTQVPELGPAWNNQVEAQAGWPEFQAADFKKLKREYGVNWVLVSLKQTGGLECKWHNSLLSVCEVP